MQKWPYFSFSHLVLCLLFLGCVQPLWAQENNAEVYRQLLKQFFEENPGPYKSLDGRFFRDYLPEISIDSSQQKQLSIEGYSILYNPLGNKRYLRSVNIPLKLDGGERALLYQDTLSGKALRKVIKRSPEVFKGEDPTSFSRWIQPAGLIGASVLGIIALFFIRSG